MLCLKEHTHPFTGSSVFGPPCADVPHWAPSPPQSSAPRQAQQQSGDAAPRWAPQAHQDGSQPAELRAALPWIRPSARRQLSAVIILRTHKNNPAKEAPLAAPHRVCGKNRKKSKRNHSFLAVNQKTPFQGGAQSPWLYWQWSQHRYAHKGTR